MLSGGCLAVVYVLNGQLQTRAELGARIDEADERRSALETRADALERRLDDAERALKGSREALALAARQRERTRALARENGRERRRLQSRLSKDVGEQKSQLVSLEEAVEGVAADVSSNRERFDQALGRLREQDGLIARNGRSLRELQERGEREYVPFDLHESKSFDRVGPVALRLENADRRRQRYTLTLIAGDAIVEMKDRTLLEPVTFYSQGTRDLGEIVVLRIDGDEVAGYLSFPKVPRPPAATARN
jgi:hypothetical protein